MCDEVTAQPLGCIVYTSFEHVGERRTAKPDDMLRPWTGVGTVYLKLEREVF